MVAVYPDLTKKQLDGDMVMRRVNEFVEAVRQVCSTHEVCSSHELPRNFPY